MILAWEWCHRLCFFAFFFSSFILRSWKGRRETRSGSLSQENGERGDTVAMPEGVSWGWEWSKCCCWAPLPQNLSITHISSSIISPLLPPAPLQHPVHRGVDRQILVKFKTKQKSFLLAYANSLCFDNESAQVTQTWGDDEISLQQYLIPLQGPSAREHLIPRLISFLCLKILSDALISRRGPVLRHTAVLQISRTVAKFWQKTCRGASRCIHFCPGRKRAGCRGNRGVMRDALVPRAYRPAPCGTLTCFYPSNHLL